jgi:hypothetical protein
MHKENFGICLFALDIDSKESLALEVFFMERIA